MNRLICDITKTITTFKTHIIEIEGFAATYCDREELNLFYGDVLDHKKAWILPVHIGTWRTLK